MPIIQKATEIDSGLSGLKLMVTGASGAGKTTLGSRCDSALIMLTERQGLAVIKAHNPDALVVEINGPSDVRDILKDLRSGEIVKDPGDGKGPALMVQDIPIRTVVMDSMTDLQRMLKDEMLGIPVEGYGGGAKRSSKGAQRETLDVGEWGIVIDRTMRLLRAFRDLPLNMLVLFLGEENHDGDKIVIRPQLFGRKLPGEVQQCFAGSGYIFRKEVSTDDGAEVKRAVMFDGGEKFPVKPFPGASKYMVPDFDVWLAASSGGGEDGHGAIDKTNGKPKGKKTKSKKTEAEASGQL